MSLGNSNDTAHLLSVSWFRTAPGPHAGSVSTRSRTQLGPGPLMARGGHHPFYAVGTSSQPCVDSGLPALVSESSCCPGQSLVPGEAEGFASGNLRSCSWAEVLLPCSVTHPVLDPFSFVFCFLDAGMLEGVRQGPHFSLGIRCCTDSRPLGKYVSSPGCSPFSTTASALCGLPVGTRASSTQPLPSLAGPTYHSAA